MFAIKILNNKFSSSTDEAGHEIVIMGKGLGWQMKAGDPIDPNKIEKICEKMKGLTDDQLHLIESMIENFKK